MEKQTKTTSPNYSLIKQIGAGAVTVLMFILFWYIAYRFFYSSDGAEAVPLLSKTSGFVGLFAGVFLVGVVVGLLGLIVEKWWLVPATYLLSILPFFLFFPFKLLHLPVVVFLMVVLVLSFFSMQREREARRRIQVHKILRLGLPAVLLMIAITMAVVYYVSSAEKIKEEGVQIPRQSFDNSGVLESYIAEAYIPGFSKNMSVSEASFQLFLNEFSKEGDDWTQLDFAEDLRPTLEAESIDVNDNAKVLTALKNNQIVREKAVELFKETSANKNLIASFGLGEASIADNQPVIDAIYNVLNSTANEFLKPYRGIMPVAFAVTFFLMLQFSNFFIKWAAEGAVWLLFKLLKAVGFLRIVKEKKEVEDIRL